MNALIERITLFGNPDRAQVRISPDGEHLSFLAPLDGVLNVWVAPASDVSAARPITRDGGRGIISYAWAPSSDRLLYLQDSDGDENWHVYSVDPSDEAVVDLTPFEGVAATIIGSSHRTPEWVAIGFNDRNPQLHDPYKVNVHTGERVLIVENPGFAGFVLDEDLEARFGLAMTPEGDLAVMRREGDGWAPFQTIPSDDSLTTHLVGFDNSGRVLYILDSRGRDTAALTALNLDTDDVTVLAADPQADIVGWMQHPTELTVEAAISTYDRKRVHVLDDAVRADLALLAEQVPGDIEIVGRTRADDVWIVAGLRDDGPVHYFRYDRASQTVTFLLSNREDLDNVELSKMHPVVIEARDGLKLVSYCTLPAWLDNDGRPPQPLPLVLMVHGGPWARDDWGYDPTHQWLANRGYAVLSVNFRSSTGFGKNFINAGNKEWAAAMHDDLLDAIDWAVAQGIADRERVAIMGGSYGGYATLVGLTFTPEVFACGVDIVGPSNLVTLIETIPPYWKPMKELFAIRIGDIDTERELLVERSPLTHAGKIVRPLLIGQGANDPRVKQAESDQIVGAMREKDIPVQYALFPDEGHGFLRPENRLAFFAVAEGFLAEHLGGRCEPVGAALEGSSIELS